MQVTLIAEDLSAVGQISMVAALNILSAFGITTIAMPTTILSTQTEAFGQPANLSTLPWRTAASVHWQTVTDMEINSALVGYVGDVVSVHQLITELAEVNPALVVIDPVMGDQGQLYPGLGNRYVAAIKQLAQSATILTPNWTELQLLTDHPLGQKPTPSKVAALLNQLPQHGILARVVVTGINFDETVAIAYQDATGQVCYIEQPKFTGHFYGAGDTFSALLCGYLQRDLPFKVALQAAAEGVYLAITATAALPVADRKFGLQLAPVLAKIAQQQ